MADASLSACSVQFGNYLAGYALNFTNASANSTINNTGQLSIQVNPNSGAIVNSTIDRIFISNWSVPTWSNGSNSSGKSTGTQ